MAHPKRRHSPSRQNKRRANWKLKEKKLVKCSHCGQLKQPHRVCLKCGYYKGKQVIHVKQKEKKVKR